MDSQERDRNVRNLLISSLKLAQELQRELGRLQQIVEGRFDEGDGSNAN